MPAGNNERMIKIGLTAVLCSSSYHSSSYSWIHSPSHSVEAENHCNPPELSLGAPLHVFLTFSSSCIPRVNRCCNMLQHIGWIPHLWTVLWGNVSRLCFPCLPAVGAIANASPASESRLPGCYRLGHSPFCIILRRTHANDISDHLVGCPVISSHSSKPCCGCFTQDPSPSSLVWIFL